MGSHKISTEDDVLHVKKALKGQKESQSDNEIIKNKILRREMFWVFGLPCSVIKHMSS